MLRKIEYVRSGALGLGRRDLPEQLVTTHPAPQAVLVRDLLFQELKITGRAFM